LDWHVERQSRGRQPLLLLLLSSLLCPMLPLPPHCLPVSLTQQQLRLLFCLPSLPFLLLVVRRGGA
jgi:hypothetical protein